MKAILRVGGAVALVLGLSVQAQPLLAAAKTPLDVYVAACVQDPGEFWNSGQEAKILHVRGQINHEYVYEVNSLELLGDVVSIVNYDLDLVSGTGGVNVSFVAFLYDVSETAPFLGTLAGRFDSFVVDARLVARGTGEAKGVRRKGRVVTVDPANVPGALLMQLPCLPDGGIYLVTGTLEDSR